MKRLIQVLMVALMGVGVLYGIEKASAGPNESLGYAKGVGLSAVALNAAAGTRTFVINTKGYAYGSVTFWMFFDYTAVAGQITLTCTGGPDDSDNAYTLTVCSASSPAGECVAVNSGIMRSVAGLAADTRWDHRLQLYGARSLSCVASHGGAPGATDKITVNYVLTEN